MWCLVCTISNVCNGDLEDFDISMINCCLYLWIPLRCPAVWSMMQEACKHWPLKWRQCWWRCRKIAKIPSQTSCVSNAAQEHRVRDIIVPANYEDGTFVAKCQTKHWTEPFRWGPFQWIRLKLISEFGKFGMEGLSRRGCGVTGYR